MAQLEICKKSLSDFLDGRRRQFPRYYFTSESDLLDILSNGSQPEKVLKHTSKVYLSTDNLELDKVIIFLYSSDFKLGCPSTHLILILY